MKKAIIIAAALSVLPVISSAHMMSPGFQKHSVATPVFTTQYKLTNHYDHPAVYTVEVLNKDMTPATGWRAEKLNYKLNPDSSAKVNLQFKVADETRKLIVCTTLVDTGKNQEKASIISRVCSRLMLISLR